VPSDPRAACLAVYGKDTALRVRVDSNLSALAMTSFSEEKSTMTNRLKSLRYAVLPLLITISLPFVAQEKNEDPTQLLNHLAGNWVLEGTLGGRHSTHDVTAEWILNHEYLRFHEVSREKNKNNRPAYEAIVIISWDNKADEYRCLWLDTTGGGGLTMGYSKRQCV
jgi:hypothetical protein